MKTFGWKEFRQSNFIIPNSGDRVSIVESEDSHPHYSNHVMKALTISLDGVELIKLSKDSWHPYVFFINRDHAMEVGLISQVADTNYSAIFDGLYYLFNPLKLTKANGAIYANVINKLRTRLKLPAFYHTVPTTKILSVVDNHIRTKFMRETGLDEHSQVLFKTMNEFLKQNNIHQIIYCYLTGQLLFRDYAIRRNFGGTYYYVHRDLDIREYNYSYDNTNDFWLRPNERVTNGYLWDVETDSLCTCPTCNRDVPHSMVQEFDECKRCAENTYKIHNYSTRVPDLLSFKAKKVRPETLYLGVELEYETTDRDVARMKVGKALKGHAIMKSDGSIRHGFEVVTCPATLDIQLDVFKLFYENKPKEITNGPNVGMHVHVSRKPLSTLTVGKLTEFMNRPDNREFVTFIAGRTLNSYCNQGTRTVTYPITHQRGERYNVLNLNNKDTIEFRIFSTPISYEDFAAKLQFCQAIVEYAKPCNLGAALKQQTFYQNFINWIMPQRKSYPELTSKLKGFA